MTEKLGDKTWSGEDVVPGPFLRNGFRGKRYINPFDRGWERLIEKFLPESMIRFIEKPSTRINLEVVVAFGIGFIAGAFWERKRGK